MTPDKIYHVTVMPCYDKKLEASRPDFFSQEHQTRDVDCVVTTGMGHEPLYFLVSSSSPRQRLALPRSCSQAWARAAVPCAGSPRKFFLHKHVPRYDRHTSGGPLKDRCIRAPLHHREGGCGPGFSEGLQEWSPLPHPWPGLSCTHKPGGGHPGLECQIAGC